MDGIRTERNRQARAAYDRSQEVLREVRTVVKGKDACVEKAFSAILAGGHILIEDVPGVGKTTLAVAFSRAMALENQRVQFTPDVQPSDILGFSMYHKDKGTFSYHPGPVMCNLFLADEINRTSPKTQSALLEVMEEGVVTVDGESHPVPAPFIVMATQNPKGSAGTQLLPDSQLDRFMITMRMGYPAPEDEVEIARGRSLRGRLQEVKQVIGVQELLELQNLVERVFIHDNIYKYRSEEHTSELQAVGGHEAKRLCGTGSQPQGYHRLYPHGQSQGLSAGQGLCDPGRCGGCFPGCGGPQAPAWNQGQGGPCDGGGRVGSDFAAGEAAGLLYEELRYGTFSVSAAFGSRLLLYRVPV